MYRLNEFYLTVVKDWADRVDLPRADKAKMTELVMEKLRNI